MNEDLKRLYQRICDYSPDDCESAFTFTQRLARDNGWQLGYARRVVDEYKKFMFLAVAAGHAVTPSEQVDQAWHLHLIYTRSYWDDFCERVLGTPIHHGPTKGGPDEQATFCDLYERTKASYRRLLDESPPPDIWPDATQRFDEDVHCVRVNTRQHWIIPKQRAQRGALVAIAAMVFVAAAAYGFCNFGQMQTERAFAINPRPVPVRDRERVFAMASMNTNPPKDRSQLISQRPRRPNREPNNSVLWGLAIGVIVVVSIGVAALFCGKCSACGRAHAMKNTGNSQAGSGWFSAAKDEWQCKFCGATIWTTHYSACGGGTGCSGGTHCGGGDSGCGTSGCGGGGCGGGGCGGD